MCLPVIVFEPLHRARPRGAADRGARLHRDDDVRATATRSRISAATGRGSTWTSISTPARRPSRWTRMSPDAGGSTSIARLYRPAAAARGLLAPGHRRPRARAAWPGRQRQQGHLSVRPARETGRPSSRKGWAARSAATCTCRTPSRSTATSSPCSTRSPTSSSKRTSRLEPHRSGPARSAVGPHPASGRHRRRRADARHARPHLQPDVEVLRGAAPAEGQRRRLPRRRLRPPAHAAGGPAEPLDRAAREPRRLPDAAHRQEVPGAVRRADRLRDQPRSALAGRRSVPPAHSIQDRHRRPCRSSSSRASSS